MRRNPPLLASALLASTLLALPVAAGAQPPAPVAPPAPEERATRAATVGYGWSHGILGVDYVFRSIRGAPRLGASVAAGFVGPAGRVTLGLRPTTKRLVPYVGAGVVTNLWGLRAGVGNDGLEDTQVLPVVDVGVQRWPAGRRGLYVDLGVGLVPGAPVDVRVQPRIAVGGAFRR